MNWNALKSGGCPKCGEILKENGPLLTCMQPCTFKIRSERALEIIRGGRNMHYLPDNQAGLASIPNPRHRR